MGGYHSERLSHHWSQLEHVSKWQSIFRALYSKASGFMLRQKFFFCRKLLVENEVWLKTLFISLSFSSSSKFWSRNSTFLINTAQFVSLERKTNSYMWFISIFSVNVMTCSNRVYYTSAYLIRTKYCLNNDPNLSTPITILFTIPTRTIDSPVPKRNGNFVAVRWI